MFTSIINDHGIGSAKRFSDDGAHSDGEVALFHQLLGGRKEIKYATVPIVVVIPLAIGLP